MEWSWSLSFSSPNVISLWFKRKCYTEMVQRGCYIRLLSSRHVIMWYAPYLLTWQKFGSCLHNITIYTVFKYRVPFLHLSFGVDVFKMRWLDQIETVNVDLWPRYSGMTFAYMGRTSQTRVINTSLFETANHTIESNEFVRSRKLSINTMVWTRERLVDSRQIHT